MAGSWRRRARRLGVAVISVLCMAGMALVGQASVANAASGTTLTVEGSSFKSSFNPWTSYSSGDLDIITVIYPYLTYLGADQKPHPYLADSWTTSKDGLTWTFKIHPGLKWSDGQPLTAKDAAWTFNLMMTNKAAATANGALISQFDKVTAPNDTTLVIHTKVPVAGMLFSNAAGGAQPGIPIVPEHIWKSQVNNLANAKLTLPVVGYGPWTLTGYKANQYATLTANKDFFLGAPKFDTLIYKPYDTPDAAVAALRSGQLDFSFSVTPAQIRALKGNKDIKVYSSLGPLWLAIEMNRGAKTKGGKAIGDGNPLLASPAIRQAITLGIDRETLVKKVLDGDGVASAAFLPSFYDDNWQPPAADKVTYDPAKANQILDAAGFTKGPDGYRTDPKTGKELSFRLGTHSDDAQDAQVASYIVPWMKAIGIKIILQPMSFATLNDTLATGKWDLLFDRWSPGPDPSYLFSTQTCGTLPDNDGKNGNTDAFYCNPAFDKLYNLQATQVDASARMDTFHKMLQILYTDGSDLILFYGNGEGAVRTANVANFMVGKPDANGNYPVQSQFLAWTQATPVNTGGSGINIGLLIGIIVIVIVVVGGGSTFLVMRKRRTADAKE